MGVGPGCCGRQCIGCRRRQHVAQVAEVVIHVVGIVCYRTVHHPLQQHLSQFIGKGVSGVTVFIGCLGDKQFAGGIVSVSFERIVGGDGIQSAGACSRRGVGQIIRFTGRSAMRHASPPERTAPSPGSGGVKVRKRDGSRGGTVGIKGRRRRFE